MGLSTLSVHSLAWHATPWMILSGVGMGMMMPPLSVAVQNSVENADLAAATSANSFFRTLGQTFGVAGLGAVMAARLRTELAARVPSEQLGKLDIRSLTGSPKAIRALPDGLREPVIASVAHAVHWVYLAALPMAVLTIACAWMIRELPLKSRSSMAETGPTD